MAMPPMRPEPKPEAIDAGPTAVHDCCDTGSVGSWVKMRYEAANWSAIGWPRPEPGTEAVRVTRQLTRLPLIVDDLLLMRSVQSPCEPWSRKKLSGSCGLNGPAPMPIVGWVAAS